MTEAQNLSPSCNPHPKAPHGFSRSASHSSDRYVCECESWDPYDAGFNEGFKAGYDASQELGNGPDLLKRQFLENFLTLTIQCATGSMDDLQAANRAQTLLAGSGPLLMGEDPLLVFARECALGVYQRDQLSLAAIIAMRQSRMWSWATTTSAASLEGPGQKTGVNAAENTGVNVSSGSTDSDSAAQSTAPSQSPQNPPASVLADSSFLLARNCPSCRRSDSWGIADRACLVRCAPTADGLGSNHEPLNGHSSPPLKQPVNLRFQSSRPYASMGQAPTTIECAQASAAPAAAAVDAASLRAEAGADDGADENLAVDGYLVVLAAQLSDHLGRTQANPNGHSKTEGQREGGEGGEGGEVAPNSSLFSAPHHACHCHRCIREKDLRDGMGWPLDLVRMVLCPDCGNKRCPKASDHALACTASNASGQLGSIYP